MSKRLIVPAALFVALTGCASQTTWYLNGYSEEQFQFADQRCRHYAQAQMDQQAMGQASYHAGRTGDAGSLAAMALIQNAAVEGFHKQCMNDHGFTEAR